MSISNPTEFFTVMVTANIRRAEAQLEKFKASLDKDPAYALEWAEDSYFAAAQLKVNKEILAALENGVDIDTIRKTLTERAMRAARYPASSSSTSSNLMATKLGAAFAQAVDEMEHC